MNTRNQDNKKNLIESAQTEFLQAWEEAQKDGSSPNLPAIARRHPQVAAELTEWAINFTARQQIMAQDTEPETISELTDRVVDSAILGLRAKPNNLNEAVKVYNWSQFKLAEKLRLAPAITAELCNGLLTDLPQRLQGAIAEALLLPASSIPNLLANSRPVAANFSANGDPNEFAHNPITFRQAIEYALEDQEISQEDANYWLEELAAEGK
ncbi:MAG TPA: hypothetical protein VF627_09170 [Abditibacterium sp.]|jgi:hypothetical protein